MNFTSIDFDLRLDRAIDGLIYFEQLVGYVLASLFIYKMIVKLTTKLLSHPKIEKVNDLFKNSIFLNNAGIKIDIKKY